MQVLEKMYENYFMEIFFLFFSVLKLFSGHFLITLIENLNEIVLSKFYLLLQLSWDANKVNMLKVTYYL